MSQNKPSSILFVCFLNSIRSPIAEGLSKKLYGSDIYVQSCGLQTGELDDLMVAIMREKGIDMSKHTAKTLNELADTSFDLVIAFTQDAAKAAEAAFSGQDTEIETWPTPDPTHGVLDVRAMMNNYRSVRDFIETRLVKRLGDGLKQDV